MNNKIAKGLFALVLLPVLTSASWAASFMPTGARTSQPIGHYDFCMANPGDCKNDSTKPGLIALSRDLWSVMQDVNNSINSMIEPVTDQALWGVEEKWSYPVNKGDCEDYVLLKRKLLEERGVPASNLLITVVRQKNGAGHAVLTMRTDRGDFVLDNLEAKILPWDQTEYRFLKRQSERSASQWVSIQDNRQMIVGSVK
ncbi:MAG: transglutaminase-like cysteine peptidase [Rhizobiaceae bacterium]